MEGGAVLIFFGVTVGGMGVGSQFADQNRFRFCRKAGQAVLMRQNLWNPANPVSVFVKAILRMDMGDQFRKSTDQCIVPVAVFGMKVGENLRELTNQTSIGAIAQSIMGMNEQVGIPALEDTGFGITASLMTVDTQRFLGAFDG